MSISILRESYSMIDKNNSIKVKHEYGSSTSTGSRSTLQFRRNSSLSLKVKVKRLTYQIYSSIKV